MTDHTTRFGNPDLEASRFGHPGLEAGRWRRIVIFLDSNVPGWRSERGKDRLGDDAIQALEVLVKAPPVGVTNTPDFYVVRPTKTGMHSDHPIYGKPGYSMFDSLLQARDAALIWAEKYKRSFTVYAVKAEGRADVVEKPVEWVTT